MCPSFAAYVLMKVLFTIHIASLRNHRKLRKQVSSKMKKWQGMKLFRQNNSCNIIIMYQWPHYFVNAGFRKNCNRRKKNYRGCHKNILIASYDIVLEIVFCILHSLKKQLYSRKQRREGHCTIDEGSMHDKLTTEYAELFLHSASPIAEHLSTSHTMEPMKARRLMSHIFEVKEASCLLSYYM